MGDVDLVMTLEDAYRKLYSHPEIAKCISAEHVQKSPERIARSLFEFYRGCWEDPKKILTTTFQNGHYDEMIYVNDIQFVSFCAHHGLPFFGKAHFAYMPHDKIVGLSKIPRLVEALAHRPQVQEKLTIDIVDTFDTVVKPTGCGMVMEAIHLCMAIRGVENESAYTKTTAIRGNFKFPAIKSEFLDGVRKTGGQLWP